MMNGKVLSFGELLLRIGIDSDGEWIASNQFSVYIGGAELNVATALALWNIPSAYFSALPDNEMSYQIVGQIKKQHIDTSKIVYSGDRIGLYYLAKGKDLKNAGVIYDRAHSSFATMDRKSIDWDTIFEGVSWFHFSAICPALNQNVADLCLDALKAASQKGIYISLDLNYRAKLWKYGKNPVEIMPALAEYCHLIMGNIWAAHQMLGTPLNDYFLHNDSYDRQAILDQGLATSQELVKRFSSCTSVANTFRFDKNEGIHYYATLYKNEQLHISPTWEKEKIINKVGSGDCFMAGLIYGYYNNFTPEETIQFATAAAVDKLDILGDATNSPIEKITEKIKKQLL